MSAVPDGGADIEIAFPVCQCAAPPDLADQLEAYFAGTNGWRVGREAGPHPRAPIGLRVTHVRGIEIKRFATPARHRDMATSAAAVILLDEAHDFRSIVAKTVSEAVADVDFVAERFRAWRPSPLLVETIWMPVFDVRTLVRTGVELHVMSEPDADRQLDALAPALNVARKNITIKPPPGWCGYGHPNLLPQTPRGI